MADHYTYRVSWSEEDREYVGSCAEFPSLSHLASSRTGALRGIEKLVRDVIADMQRHREPIPTPFADQPFSGKFVTRIPAELHRQLAIEAAEAGMSLNRLVSFKLAGPIHAGRYISAEIQRAVLPEKHGRKRPVDVKSAIRTRTRTRHARARHQPQR